jgi:hypothetical protein
MFAVCQKLFLRKKQQYKHLAVRQRHRKPLPCIQKAVFYQTIIRMQHKFNKKMVQREKIKAIEKGVKATGTKENPYFS